MARVCFSMLLLILLLSACASDNPKPVAKLEQVDTPAAGENILACTGLPVAGQKCGLALPKI